MGLRFELSDITGLVLAGGRGARMGGVDKGLQPFRHQSLAARALDRLRAQGPLADVWLNANRHLDAYAALGARVCVDPLSDHPGPLAGFLAGLSNCPTPLMLTVACDTPFFPVDLAPRLLQALNDADVDIAMAAGLDVDAPDATPAVRAQPVFCLMHQRVLGSLRDYVEGGQRQVGRWVAQQRHALVRFDDPGDDPHAFANVNTLDDLHRLGAV